jgi:hypothetical protein
MSFPRAVSYQGWVGPSLALLPLTQAAGNQGRLAYFTASGERGEIHLPFDTRPGNGMGSARMLWRSTLRPWVSHVLQLNDGVVQEGFPAPLSDTPALGWSADGRRLALETGDNSFEITVMNADGSAPRRYDPPLPVRPYPRPAHQRLGTGGNQNFLVWSRDQGTLAWRGPSGQRVILLDLASGTTSALTNSGGVIGDFVWRTDGQSLLVLKAIEPATGDSAHTAIVEISRDGTERRLRDLTAEFPWASWARLPSDRVAVLGDARFTRMVSVAPDGGEARELPMPRADSGVRVMGATLSRDGKWVLLGLAGNADLTEVLIVSTAGGPWRTIRLPFRGANRGMILLPDQRHLLLAGRTAADPALKLFLVPLDGGTAREFGGTSSRFAGTLGSEALSPDGRRLVFLSAGAPASTIYELDLSSLLRTAGKR